MRQQHCEAVQAKGLWGLMLGRFRFDPSKSSMVVRKNRGSFMLGPFGLGTMCCSLRV